jgi:hypothetical protein
MKNKTKQNKTKQNKTKQNKTTETNMYMVEQSQERYLTQLVPFA